MYNNSINKMPDLSDLTFPISNELLLFKLAGLVDLKGRKTLSSKEWLYRTDFIRLVDKSLREYTNARNIIIKDIIENSTCSTDYPDCNDEVIYLMEFTDHIETCIDATARLFKHLDKMKSFVPATLRMPLGKKATEIRNIRNTFQHIYDNTQNDKINKGQPIVLTISSNENDIMIGQYRISFEDLATIIRKMHGLALYLLGYQNK